MLWQCLLGVFVLFCTDANQIIFSTFQILLLFNAWLFTNTQSKNKHIRFCCIFYVLMQQRQKTHHTIIYSCFRIGFDLICLINLHITICLALLAWDWLIFGVVRSNFRESAGFFGLVLLFRMIDVTSDYYRVFAVHMEFFGWIRWFSRRWELKRAFVVSIRWVWMNGVFFGNQRFSRNWWIRKNDKIWRFPKKMDKKWVKYTLNKSPKSQ